MGLVSVFFPPPCGEGSGVGVTSCGACGYPPPRPSPARGEGEESGPRREAFPAEVNVTDITAARGEGVPQAQCPLTPTPDPPARGREARGSDRERSGSERP